MELKWENIAGRSRRLRVFGGWIVIAQDGDPNVPRECGVFIPDPYHQWTDECDTPRPSGQDAVTQDAGLPMLDLRKPKE